MSSVESPITDDDFRAVVRILGDIAAMHSSPDEKRRHLMTELGLLIGTETWLWGLAPFIEPGRQPVYVFQNRGGLDEERASRLLMAIEHPDTGAMTAPIAQAMVETGCHVTRLRQDIIPDERFLNSPAHAFWKAANVGPIILSLRPIAGYGSAVIAFYRPVAAPAFTAREARIAHIVLSEVGWLHHEGMPHQPSSTIPVLPPRRRLILHQLLIGRTRKGIAADLGISIHTVNDHMKQIYRHFSVHSQAQLIARFRSGDGRDRP